jgi:phospholipid-translocating ATPase
MFQHNRSNSDVSNSGDGYEPSVAPIPSRSPMPQFTTTPAISPVNGPLAPEARLRVNPHARGGLSPSPSERIPSYYSASDLPAPSPMPDPIYKYPTGEITTTAPSTRTSVMSKGSLRTSHAPMPSTSSQLPQDLVQPPEAGSHTHSEVFEMHVRAPSGDQGTSHSHTFKRSASPASYATAIDSYHTVDDGAVLQYDFRGSPHASPGHGWPLEDGHTTDFQSRSASPSWEGPRAV